MHRLNKICPGNGPSTKLGGDILHRAIPDEEFFPPTNNFREGNIETNNELLEFLKRRSEKEAVRRKGDKKLITLKAA